jgi:hypothetical protein
MLRTEVDVEVADLLCSFMVGITPFSLPLAFSSPGST